MVNQSSMPTWTFFRKILAPFRWHFTGLCFINLIWAIDVSLRPYIIKLIIDKLETVPRAEVSAQLFPYALLFLAFTLVTMAFFRWWDYLLLRMLPALRKNIIEFLLFHVMGQAHAFFQNVMTGTLANKINDVAIGTCEALETALENFIGHSLVLAIAIATLSSVHPMLGFFLFIWVTFFVGGAIISAFWAHRLADDASDSYSHMTGTMVDILSNMFAVRLFVRKRDEQAGFEKQADGYVTRARRLDWFFFYVNIFQALSFVLVIFGSLIFLLKLREKGAISIGDFALVMSINGEIVMFLWNFSKDFSSFIEYMGKISQGLRLTTTPHTLLDAPAATNLKVEGGDIEFKDVTFYYKGPKALFRNLNVTIPGGQNVGLVGYSGSGKTTFINILLRLFDIEAGQVNIDNQNIATVTQGSLHEAITLIPQDPILFHRSLLENLTYGRIGASMHDVVEASKRAHVHEFVENFPDQYNAAVGDRGTKLSGGQRQRIAIARAILRNSPILILDEATSALDSITERLIQSSLEDLMRGKTTLVIAHRLSTLLSMDRILVFDEGKIIEDGNHKQLLAKRGFYYRLWKAQIGGFLQDTIDDDDDEDHLLSTTSRVLD